MRPRPSKSLQVRAGSEWVFAGEGETNSDGRVPNLLPGEGTTVQESDTATHQPATHFSRPTALIPRPSAMPRHVTPCAPCAHTPTGGTALASFPSSTFRLTFDTASYFEAIGTDAFYPGESKTKR